MSIDNWVDILIALFSFFAGFAVKTFFMTKKEREDIKCEKQDRSNRLESEVIEAGNEYSIALSHLTQSGDFNTFMSINNTGERYFNALNALACAIVSDTIDENSAINSHVHKLRSAYTKIIPEHYTVLRSLANKCNVPYNTIFKAENYRSIRVAINKYK
ncbi:TPA: hypothetical protein ACSP17_002395 [Aeromonas hydrophila]